VTCSGGVRQCGHVLGGHGLEFALRSGRDCSADDVLDGLKISANQALESTSINSPRP